jgi:glycosyltransferase involved in cell wall biosynthesis
MNDVVSIVMPSYNTGAYIAESIRSVLEQTYTDWELLIVDDCSTDDTVEVIRSFDDPRIVLLQNETNSGAALSRNYALREAKGRWIAFLDSDDLWEPDKLEKQLSFMKTYGYAFSFTDYRICLNGTWMPYINIGPDVVNRRMMYRYCYFSTITVMYDRERIGLIQIADIRKNNDYAMWLQAIEKSDAYRLPECLSYYIKHDDSVTGGSKVALIKWHYRLFRTALDKPPLTSAAYTVRNLFFGVLKKMIYKKPVNT